MRLCVHICSKYIEPGFCRKDYRYAFTTHFVQFNTMTSIGDYRKIMDGLDGWNEAAGFVRPEDVERWNADDQITLKTFPILLKMSITAPTVRSKLLADNLLLIGVAESAATHNDPQEQPSAKADEPEDKKPEEERPREDFNISLDYWTDLSASHGSVL